MTECSETSAYNIQIPGNYPEENIQQKHTTYRTRRKFEFKAIYFIRTVTK